jgi:DNA topoisomerase IB
VAAFGKRLPIARQRVSADLALPGMPRRRVLATAFQLLDRGLFRVGEEQYTLQNGSFGLATLRKEHIRITSDAVIFEYQAKSGIWRSTAIDADPCMLEVLARLKRRRTGGADLLAWRDGDRWRDVASDDVNAYLKEVVAPDASAKDFRTWHATVLAATALAGRPRPRSVTAARREVTAAMKQVADFLGNTPAICRASYVDPVVIDRFLDGVTLPARLRLQPEVQPEAGPLVTPPPDPALERAVLRLLHT